MGGRIEGEEGLMVGWIDGWIGGRMDGWLVVDGRQVPGSRRTG